MFRSFNKRAHRLRVGKVFMTMLTLLYMAIPAKLMAVDVTIDTTPEDFQGSERLVNFLNKAQTALIIVLVILFSFSIVKMVIDHRAGRGIKLEATGLILAVVGIIVVSNPAYWIELIGSLVGG